MSRNRHNAVPCACRVRRALLRFGAALVQICLSIGISADVADSPCRAGEGCVDFWVVDTRPVPRTRDPGEGLERIAIWHREPTGWTRFSRQRFHEAVGATLPVCFYVPGTFSSGRASLRQASDLFERVGAGVPPFRGVSWLWPSQFVRSASICAQVNRVSAQSEREGEYLAAFIGSLDPATPISLVGHSVGCRTILAALDGLGSGRIGGRPWPQSESRSRRHIQAALVAAAIDRRALLPGGKYERALPETERMLITFNPRDRVLRVYERRFEGQVLGLHGMPKPAAEQGAATKLIQLNLNSAVRRRHVPRAYFASPLAASWLRGFVVDVRAVSPSERRAALHGGWNGGNTTDKRADVWRTKPVGGVSESCL